VVLLNSLFPYLARVIAAAVAITIHEYVKASVSTALGDLKPREQGRLTFNPLKHLDFLGFFAMWYTGLGWGKPVVTSNAHYKNRRTGVMLTYITPVAANVLCGFIFALIMRAVNQMAFTPALAYISVSLRITAFYNVTLGLFNLIPVYPLCGEKIIRLFLKPNAAVAMSRYEKIFQIVLMVLIFMGFLNIVINPAATFLLGFAA